ncbi:MAG: ATP-binding protein [Burkholderiales bacterium]|nr:ATP-binding protein [Burkholderiales bacterium]
MSEPANRPTPCRLQIAIVGAESTGKTTLARELAAALAAPRRDAGPGPHVARIARVAPAARVALVGEVLREWCIAAGRTPGSDEQRGILLEQHRRVDAAAATHDIVVSDTTALMTHVYSDLLFDDRSLLPLAIERHRTMTVTLLTALDLPWVADGHQRDGEHVRRPVDDRLRELLMRHGLPFSVVAGSGPARLAQALAALRPLLVADTDTGPILDPVGHASPPRVPARAGLFTRLSGPPEPALFEGPPSRLRGWVCECCWPEAERTLLARRGDTESGRLDAPPSRSHSR